MDSLLKAKCFILYVWCQRLTEGKQLVSGHTASIPLTSDPFQGGYQRSQWHSAQKNTAILTPVPPLPHHHPTLPHPTLPSPSLVPPSWLFSIWRLRGNPPGETVAGIGLPHLGLWGFLPLVAPEMARSAGTRVLVD